MSERIPEVRNPRKDSERMLAPADWEERIGVRSPASCGAAGHDVYTPSLTGLGDRVHLLRPDVNLETLILVNLLVYEDLADVVLVAHRSSSVPVRGAAERVPERVARLVYLS